MADIIDSLYEEHKEPEDESDIIVVQDLALTCPVLHDFVRFTKFNGKCVTTPRLGYSVQDGKLYTTLSDSERRRSLRVECLSFIEGCETIENHIQQRALGTLWYQWPQNGKQSRKNSKRGSSGHAS
ncbi:unnamed protein product [marine sediment metagenome]|uniref:Uncharacterized protein n=1 Tax=marine sediment metagenome TaxID=412755 RepID=X0ZI53_9ZZZZ